MPGLSAGGAFGDFVLDPVHEFDGKGGVLELGAEDGGDVPAARDAFEDGAAGIAGDDGAAQLHELFIGADEGACHVARGKLGAFAVVADDSEVLGGWTCEGKGRDVLDRGVEEDEADVEAGVVAFAGQVGGVADAAGDTPDGGVVALDPACDEAAGLEIVGGLAVMGGAMGGGEDDGGGDEGAGAHVEGFEARLVYAADGGPFALGGLGEGGHEAALREGGAGEKEKEEKRAHGP
ncbi:MAG: hypothetical protein AAGG57_13700 [Pseudomonadota bacterium]